LNEKVKKNGPQSRGPTKNLGVMAHPDPPLESPLTMATLKLHAFTYPQK